MFTWTKRRDPQSTIADKDELYQVSVGSIWNGGIYRMRGPEGSSIISWEAVIMCNGHSVAEHAFLGIPLDKVMDWVEQQIKLLISEVMMIVGNPSCGRKIVDMTN